MNAAQLRTKKEVMIDDDDEGRECCNACGSKRCGDCIDGDEFICKYCIDPQLERLKYGSRLWNGGEREACRG